MDTATEESKGVTRRDERFHDVLDELEEIKQKVVASKDGSRETLLAPAFSSGSWVVRSFY